MQKLCSHNINVIVSIFYCQKASYEISVNAIFRKVCGTLGARASLITKREVPHLIIKALVLQGRFVGTIMTAAYVKHDTSKMT